MGELDALIESVKASIAAVEKKLAEADAEKLPNGAIEAIQKSLADLRKTWDELVDLAFRQGLENKLPIDPPLELKKKGE